MENHYNPENCEEIELDPIGCLREGTGECLPLAMAYIPWQKWNKVYANDVALNRGTIFPELDKPYLGEEVM